MPAVSLAVAFVLSLAPSDVVVATVDAFRSAVRAAKPGGRILVQPGTYEGAFYFEDLHGKAGLPIVISATDSTRRPKFVGGGSTLQFSRVSHLEIRDLIIERPLNNGLNIDDGGVFSSPSHHVVVSNLLVRDLPDGNNDAIKLSGLEKFRIENCRAERWGGSGVDMVGCHDGEIVGCIFSGGGDTGVQTKGGTSSVTIERCQFENFGNRGVNIGGSTGMPFFRPPVEKMPSQAKYEARSIVVQGCTFNGGDAAVAFVGVDGAVVRFNTLYHPNRWAIRILQETSAPEFVRCRDGVFEDNLVVFRSDKWFEGGVNIGPSTLPRTFRFARNYWYCSDTPERSAPSLPTVELGGTIGKDPLFVEPASGNLSVRPRSPAATVGAHAFEASKASTNSLSK